MLVVGDVCGKGPQAAAVTALARYTLRAHAVAGLRPSYMLARLNDQLLRQHAPGFVTVALARLDLHERGATVALVTAGHPLPIVAQGAAPRPAARSAPRWASSSSPTLPELALELAPGDLIAFYTDGVSEAAAPKRILDEADLAALVAERAADGPGPGGRAPGGDRGRHRGRQPARRHRVPGRAGDAARASPSASGDAAA